MTDKLPEDDRPLSIPHVREDDALIEEIEHYSGRSPLLRKLSQLAKNSRDGTGHLPEDFTL